MQKSQNGLQHRKQMVNSYLIMLADYPNREDLAESYLRILPYAIDLI